MSKTDKSRSVSLGHTIEECLRQMLYYSNHDDVIEYAARAAGMKLEEFKEALYAQKIAHHRLFADH